MRKIIFFLMLLLYLDVFAQKTWVELNIPNVQQEANKLCWAASLKSILDYHNTTPPKSQKNLVDNLYNLRNKNFLFCNGTLTCIENSTTLCNLTAKTLKDNYEYLQIVNKNGYYAMQDTIFLKWEEIKAQINQTTPFILVVNNYLPNLKPGGTSKLLDKWRNQNYTHAIVAKGYIENGANKFVLVNDPLACNGNDFIGLEYLKYPFCPNNSTHAANEVIESLHDIRPKSKQTDNILEIAKKKATNINTLPAYTSGAIVDIRSGFENRGSLVSISNNKITNIMMDTDPNRKEIHTKYLLPKSIRFCFFQKPTSQYLKNDIVDVYSSTQGELSLARLEKVDDKYQHTAGYKISNSAIKDRLLKVAADDYVVIAAWENNRYHYRKNDNKVSPIVEDITLDGKVILKAGEFISEKQFLKIMKKKYYPGIFPFLNFKIKPNDKTANPPFKG